jgi:hypothetical protein
MEIAVEESGQNLHLFTQWARSEDQDRIQVKTQVTGIMGDWRMGVLEQLGLCHQQHSAGV